jgi:hypothetical protein
MKSSLKEQSTAPDSPGQNEPRQRRDQPGYYPRFSTLSQQSFWDEATRRTVTDRVKNIPPIRFFEAKETEFWKAVFDHLLPQDDRREERRVPILNFVDHRLHSNQTAGYRFDNMPHDREAYRLGMQAINQEARHLLGSEFVGLTYPQREAVLKVIHDGEPHSAKEIWQKMSVHRFWQLIMGDAIDAYYGHPWAWDEIGFGGPAYPRAYMRLERGEPEPWEVEEQRYEWRAPAGTLSDEIESTHEYFTESVQHSSHFKIRTRNKGVA